MITAQHIGVGCVELLDIEEVCIGLLHTEGATGEDKGKDVYLTVDVVLEVQVGHICCGF